MTDPVPFTFAIPLLPRACARNWELIEHLLELTMASAFAQTDQRFRVVVAGHDRPQGLPDDRRVEFFQAHWPFEAVRMDNLDRGRKTSAVNGQVLASGGGLLMVLDADDWVDTRLVETARATIGPDHVAGVIETGFAADFHSLRIAPVPHPHVFDREFHRICGSSAVIRLRPNDPDPVRRDPYRLLHEHYRLVDIASEHGLGTARLPVSGCYVINTSDNHSEVHGPYAEWRTRFNQAVNRSGRPIEQALASRFGLGLDRVRAISHRFRALAFT
jgi:hypothetical protein